MQKDAFSQCYGTLILVSKGYDVGEVDGKLGRASRTAVRAEQQKMGWPADAYPTVEFLEALKRG